YPQYTIFVQKEKKKCIIFDKTLLDIKSKILLKLKNLKIKFKEHTIDNNFSVIIFEYNEDDKNFLI
ncbi:MAG: hypothetical protein NZ839_01095, partial [Endomicrobia bacterium]|nr:hypothetical protein [Endomicrobiia bacterium]